MPRILVTCRYESSLLIRQTPGSTARWGDFEFVFEPMGTDPGGVDGWVVLDDLPELTTQSCSPDTTLLITGEPESVRRYRSRFTSQFSAVWTSHQSIKHPGHLLQNEAQHWHYGMRSGAVHGDPLSYDDLCRMTAPEKTRIASVICSNKAITPDHRKRLEFVQALQQKFGDQIDVFGRGIRPMEDKSEAIWPYKYHIVLENDHCDYFMTEKISDAFLGYSYPIYFGGKEADKRFGTDSFSRINIYNETEAFQTIAEIIGSDKFENASDAVQDSRDRVLHANNLMAMIAEFFSHRLNHPVRPPRPITLHEKCDRVNLVIQQIKRSIAAPFQKTAPLQKAA